MSDGTALTQSRIRPLITIRETGMSRGCHIPGVWIICHLAQCHAFLKVFFGQMFYTCTCCDLTSSIIYESGVELSILYRHSLNYKNSKTWICIDHSCNNKYVFNYTFNCFLCKIPPKTVLILLYNLSNIIHVMLIENRHHK